MATVLGEDTPLNTNLAGEQDDHMRAMKTAVKTLFEKGHILSDPADATVDGQLKFGERVNAPAYASSVTLDLSDGTIHVLSLTGDCTLAFSNPPDNGLGSPVNGFGFTLIVKQTSAGGGDTVTFPSAIMWLNNVEPSLNTDEGAETHYSFYTINAGVGSNGSGWYGFCSGYYNV